MDLIYIGDHFYEKSGTAMSSLYSTAGYRSDWGFVKSALRDGSAVNIRPATAKEKIHYEKRLKILLRKIAMETEFLECAACAAMPGCPKLCASCVNNRAVIEQLKADKRDLFTALKSSQVKIPAEVDRTIRWEP